MAEQTSEHTDEAADVAGVAGPGDSEQRRVRLRVDESKMDIEYINAFRTQVSGDEVIVDVGMNLLQPNRGGAGSSDGEGANGGEIVNATFLAQSRLVLNPKSAKRLAMLLSDHVRRIEQQRGEIKLD